MEIKMSQIRALREIEEKIIAKDLPIAVSYKFAKVFRAVDKEHEYYTHEMRKLLLDYSEKDDEGNPKMTEDGQNVRIKPEFIQEANNRLDELLNLDIILPDIKFTLDELSDLKFSIMELDALMPFIEEENV